MVAKQGQKTTYKAKVTGRHAVTLPAKMCRALGIENGDTVEFEVDGNHAVVRKAEVFDPSSLRGIWADDFPTWKSIVDYVETERAAWDRGDLPANDSPE